MLLGCTTEERAAVTGGAIGAGAGAIIGHQSGETGTGAAIGGAVGLVGGYIYGKTRKTAEGVIETYAECPRCGAAFTLPGGTTRGARVRCPRCGSIFGVR